MHTWLSSYGEHGVILLDGGMGQELRSRAQNDPTSLWSAQVMLDQPDLVSAVHQDYVAAGARILTTNTYSTVRHRLAEHSDLEDRFEELVMLAVEFANQARARSDQDLLIAGSLPPLWGSYMPDRVQPYQTNLPIYQELVALMSSGVDVFLCETMSTAEEARAAAEAAASSGKPVWVSWTVADDQSGLLRSGETIPEAWAAIDHLDIDGLFVNCSSPEAIDVAIPPLVRTGVPIIGAYANGFNEIPAQWSVKDGVDRLGRRENLTPEAYANHVRRWIDDGANVVGGCCEVGPDHIRYLSEQLGDSLLG